MIRRSCVAAVALAILCSASAPDAQTAPQNCVAIPVPSLRGVDGDATELATSVRELADSFLAGPSLRVVPLEARLAVHAVEEARQKECGTLLVITLTRKRSGGGGGLGRVLGSAANAAAYHTPYGGAAAAAARSAAVAAANIASNTRAKDEWTLEYRLTSVGDGKALRSGSRKKKADADGEDVVTPLAEQMATEVVTAIIK